MSCFTGTPSSAEESSPELQTQEEFGNIVSTDSNLNLSNMANSNHFFYRPKHGETFGNSEVLPSCNANGVPTNLFILALTSPDSTRALGRSSAISPEMSSGLRGCWPGTVLHLPEDCCHTVGPLVCIF